MTFLKLDNWSIPTLQGGSAKAELGGDFGEAFSGKPLGDVRWRRHKWEFTTTAMDTISARALIGMLMREGHSWDFESSLYSFNGRGRKGTTNGIRRLATAADGTALYSRVAGTTVAKAEAKFGNYSLAFEPATVNILPSNQRNPETTAGFAAIAGGSLSVDSTRYVVGTKSLEVSVASSGSGVETSAVACLGDQQYVGSVYVLHTDAGDRDYEISLIDDVGTVASATLTVGTPRVWVRLVITGKTAVAATTIKLRVTRTGSLSDFKIDALQIELGSRAKTWVDGTRTNSGGNLQYAVDLSHVDSFTASGWARCAYDGANGVLFAIEDADGSSYVEIDFLEARWRNANGGTGSAVHSSAPDPTDGDWHHFAVTLRGKRESDGAAELEWYLDGTSQGSATTNLPTVRLLDTIVVGDISAIGYLHLLDSLRFHPFAITDAIAAAWASATEPPGRIPRLRLTGRCLDAVNGVDPVGGIEVEGSQTDSAFFGEADSSGVWRPHHQRISFELRGIPR